MFFDLEILGSEYSKNGGNLHNLRFHLDSSDSDKLFLSNFFEKIQRIIYYCKNLYKWFFTQRKLV